MRGGFKAISIYSIRGKGDDLNVTTYSKGKREEYCFYSFYHIWMEKELTSLIPGRLAMGLKLSMKNIVVEAEQSC